MTTECQRTSVDERVDAAAHRLHETHKAWARSAITQDPAQCYQCNVFARIVAEALDASEAHRG